MDYEYEFTFEDVKESGIAAFESKYGIQLPKQYRDFLIRNNGGKRVKRRFDTANKKIETSVMLFFPISEEAESNLEAYYRDYTLKNVLPSKFLPIGRDPMDSLICLVIEGEETGQVYFCDLDYLEEDNGLSPECIYFVSNNFEDFIALLRESE
ncbi:SMI1/KNR4 family protein [Paenibacillus tepidiphilus]|uniref:SMI1/KNR4 family protein n=1 Tax=Paenibacillus tepidiphilus TaxID=2608683 RepID=UPI001EF112E7|nr:SMI1/KNR4 family protein [Paenibacillus tepidiphilus]